MELPINVIIVFFVSLVVAGAIISLAGSNIRQSADYMESIQKNDKSIFSDGFIALEGQIEKTIIEMLGQQCVKDMLANAVMEETICFIVRGESIDANLINLDQKNYDYRNIEWEFNVESYNINSKSIFIFYDPKGKIIIRE